MWLKIVIVALLIYIFALLQGSFFVYFNLFGVTPNLVFILFFLLVFFGRDLKSIARNYQIIFLAALGGIFLDVISYNEYIGSSIVLFLIIGFLLKNLQSLLKNIDDNYSLFYFLPLFILFLSIYIFLRGTYLFYIDCNRIITPFGLQSIYIIVYNSTAATIFFIFYKKFLRGRV